MNSSPKYEQPGEVLFNLFHPGDVDFGTWGSEIAVNFGHF